MKELKELRQPQVENEVIPIEGELESLSEGKKSSASIPMGANTELITETKKPLKPELKNPLTKSGAIKETKQLSKDSSHTSFEKQKESADLNMDANEVEEIQRLINSYIERIKKWLHSANKKMKELINDHVVIGEIENAEYEVISVEMLMKIVRKICPNEFTVEELKDIEELFKQLGTSDYVFVENLLEFFGELTTCTF